VRGVIISIALLSLTLSFSWPADGRRPSVVATIRPATDTCVNCPPMVKVPGLPSRLGSAIKPLYVARHELTWKEYLQAVREAGCPMPLINDVERYKLDVKLEDSYPVTSIPLPQFECYLNWIRRKTGLRYRLPTGVEWEHAARAGSVGNYYWGEELGQNRAIVAGHFDIARVRSLSVAASMDLRSPIFSGVLAPVESLAPNAWGLFDTIGNASEATAEMIDGPPTCLKRQSKKWCELIAGRGGDGFATNAKTLMTDKQMWLSGAPNPMLGFRLVHD
jgi:hypothetical protein